MSPGSDAGDGDGDAGDGPYTVEECVAMGALPVGNPGDGSSQGCPNAAEPLGEILGFIEGGYCCPIALDCDAQVAEHSGNCRIADRYYFDGMRCVPRSGCTCEGQDCAAGFDNERACRDQYFGCDLPMTCASHGDCDADQFCAPLIGCGRLEGIPSVCFQRPSACDTELFPACGCDGQTYDNPCEVLRARVGIDANAACED